MPRQKLAREFINQYSVFRVMGGRDIALVIIRFIAAGRRSPQFPQLGRLSSRDCAFSEQAGSGALNLAGQSGRDAVTTALRRAECGGRACIIRARRI